MENAKENYIRPPGQPIDLPGMVLAQEDETSPPQDGNGSLPPQDGQVTVEETRRKSTEHQAIAPEQTNIENQENSLETPVSEQPGKNEIEEEVHVENIETAKDEPDQQVIQEEDQDAFEEGHAQIDTESAKIKPPMDKQVSQRILIAKTLTRVGSVKQINPDVEAGKPLEARIYQGKKKKVKRVLDLLTYSPYIKTRRLLGILRSFLALYLWVSLFVSIPLWGDASQYTRGNYPCTKTEHKVGVFFTHPTFWNLWVCASKLSLGAYLCLKERNVKLRFWYLILEHLALPGVLTYSVYFWGAHKRLDSDLSLGVAFNNNLAIPIVLLMETWVSKTPFLLERIWQIILYMIWQVLWVLLFSFVSEGCFLIPTLNPDRNIMWIAYPGLTLLYSGGYFVVYAFTQVRDHVGPCGQRVFPPAQRPIIPNVQKPAKKPRELFRFRRSKTEVHDRSPSVFKQAGRSLTMMGKQNRVTLDPGDKGNDMPGKMERRYTTNFKNNRLHPEKQSVGSQDEDDQDEAEEEENHHDDDENTPFTRPAVREAFVEEMPEPISPIQRSLAEKEDQSQAPERPMSEIPSIDESSGKSNGQSIATKLFKSFSNRVLPDLTPTNSTNHIDDSETTQLLPVVKGS